MTEVFVEATEFVELFDEFVFLLLAAFLFGAGGGGLDVLIQIIDAGLHSGLQGHDVFHAHTRQRTGVVAVQVHESFKGFVLAGAEQPVDGPFFVGLQVVFVEVAAEVAADGVVGGFAGFLP